MADHRLGRRAGQRGRFLSKGKLHRASFDPIVQVGRGAVIVQVPHVARADIGILHGKLHRPRRLLARFLHADAVMRVARRAIARDFGVNARAARLGGLFALHDEHPSAFSEDETVAIF